MFQLQSFPARDGDAFILTWGSRQQRHRMLIDCGRESCWPLIKAEVLKLPYDERQFELLVVTHIDADHIAGVLKMLKDPELPLSFREVWFNGYKHLKEFSETFGPNQGEKLSTILDASPQTWNTSFGHQAVVVRDHADPPRLDLEGLQLTLLSPTPAKLAQLEPEWLDWLKREGLETGQLLRGPPPPVSEEPAGFERFGRGLDVEGLAQQKLPRDSEPPNGSSIAFAAQYGQVRVLLTGDAHADVLDEAIAALPDAERRYDLVKLSHHGSRGNISAELISHWEASRFLISTDGSRHGHPDAQTIARLIKARPGSKIFYFNHHHQQAAVWDDASLMAEHDYQSIYPDVPGCLTLDLETWSLR